MNNVRFSIGIILLLVAVVLFFYLEDVKNDRFGLLGNLTIEKVVQMCNGGWGDAFNVVGSCLKVQGFYYSPWISGFVGLIFLIKAGPYRGYHGYGGAGSHNRRRVIRAKTKKRIYILIVVSTTLVLGIFLNVNYDITIGNQKINDIVPLDSIGQTFEQIKDNVPIKIEPKQQH